ncbi:ATP-binding protein [Candidatus Shapirobacteria bacterium]|nr:MAG: ATP-binding protein [Candidatus Shapirobacteria bacterium]
MPYIQVKNLTKKFGKFIAVDHISFSVQKGEVFALLGPNGAGKTTTIRILTGLYAPDGGTVKIGGLDIQKHSLQVKQKIGIVPEMANPYLDWSAYKNLFLMGELYGLDKEVNQKRIKELLDRFQLSHVQHKRSKSYSKGMKQRLVLAMALMADPQLLILDEPSSGLDVQSARLIRQVITDFHGQGKTTLLTTHDIKEAEQLADRVAIINHGRIVAIDRPQKLKQTFQQTASLLVSFQKQIEVEDLKFLSLNQIKKEGDKFRLYSQNIPQLIPLLVNYSTKSKNPIIFLHTLGPSLEDVFVNLTKQ